MLLSRDNSFQVIYSKNTIRYRNTYALNYIYTLTSISVNFKFRHKIHVIGIRTLLALIICISFKVI